MEQWKKTVFKTYCKGDGKRCLDKHKGLSQVRTFEEASKFDSFGGILQPNYVDISFDDAVMSDVFLKMADSVGWHFLAIRNNINGHLHTFWRKPKGFGKDGKDKMLACGLIADIHSGDTYIPLKVDGHERFPPIRNYDDYDIVPEELFQVTTKSVLWMLKEGEGRNAALSSRAKFYVNNGTFSKTVIIRILNIVNRFIFADPLDQTEIDTILRDETFNIEDPQNLEIISANELQLMDVQPVEFIIQGLIPIGLTILASPPKYGKSYMCMDMILSVASGNSFLGFSTNRCPVLYMALEDRNDRLKQRMQQVLGGKRAPDGLFFTTDSNTLDNGLLEQLEEVVLKDGVRFVVIDTFVKIRGEPKRNETVYSTDSREAGILKRFADDHNIACLLVTHTRKGIDQNDPFANITGTYGISGAADDMIVLSKDKRSDNLTKMSVTGRDVVFEEYPIVFDKERGRWLKQGDSYELIAAKIERDVKMFEYKQGKLRTVILRLLEENSGEWKGRCETIIKKAFEYGFPLSMTSQQLGKELSKLDEYLLTDNIIHTNTKKGTASIEHKFQKTLHT